MHFNVALVLASIASAVVAIPTSIRGGPATCSLQVLPLVETVPPDTNFIAEFNALIVKGVSGATNGTALINTGATFIPKSDGSFIVRDTVIVDGLSTNQTDAVIEGLFGQLITGVQILWLVEKIECFP